MNLTLNKKIVAVPEVRELELIRRMLSDRGAEVLACSLVNIIDHPDQLSVRQWLQTFISGQMDDLILFTGEGVRRLMAAAERDGVREDVLRAFDRARKITRGPKPVRALREIGMKANIEAAHPTTPGLIDTLKNFDLFQRCIGVQRYGDVPNLPFIEFLEQKGARVFPVSPYAYADAAQTKEVEQLIETLIGGTIDVLALTSAAQWQRLIDVSRAMDRLNHLRNAHQKNAFFIAAVGPVVAEQVRKDNFEPDAMPEPSFSMKPLVREIECLCHCENKSS